MGHVRLPLAELGPRRLLLLCLLVACAPSADLKLPASPAVTCRQDVDCPDSSEPCRFPVCREGRCSLELARPGTFPEQGQQSGDCQRYLCGVGGELIAREDPADLPPDDGNPCTREVCLDGAPRRLPQPPGAGCGAGVCTSAGTCVGLEEIAVGRYHGCIRLGDGSVHCWGAAERGQLGGEEDTGSRVTPTPVPNLTGARALALGGNHTCALLQEEIVCWGANEHGQLGDGGIRDRTLPMPVQGLRGASAIAAGLDTTCALAQGAVFCWGLGTSGQLGNRRKSSSQLPVKVLFDAPGGSQLPVPIQISVGGGHACALLSGGQAHCWGANDHGQLGDGTVQSRAAPVAVADLDRVKQLAAGRNHTCALREDGSVWCWGLNNDGQLATSDREDARKPRRVAAVAGAVEVAAGNSHNCVRLGSGKVLCWGWNRDGQVGGDVLEDALEPVEVVAAQGALQLALGSKHSCARLRNGTFTCWGNNSRGQLGKE
ncbi:MAG: hypothetical protein RMJ98_10525 [Myxococcales bacterium]|nr:hypothetical protein [Polyangiaceae bacterium]MDW8249721.1 hypothetical protein [Myxococcales bacterium]